MNILHIDLIYIVENPDYILMEPGTEPLKKNFLEELADFASREVARIKPIPAQIGVYTSVKDYAHHLPKFRVLVQEGLGNVFNGDGKIPNVICANLTPITGDYSFDFGYFLERKRMPEK